MDQMMCDKLMFVANMPDGKKFVFYNALRHKIEHLKVDHAYDAVRLVSELKVVLDMFSNLLVSDPMLNTTCMDVMPVLQQLQMHATNAMPMPMDPGMPGMPGMPGNTTLTESSMEMINTDLMNIAPMLGYDPVSEQDLNMAHDAFMMFFNRNINSTPFDMLAMDINNVKNMMNPGWYGGENTMPFDAHTLSNLEIYDMSADFVEAAGMYQTAWDIMHMAPMPPAWMPPM